jgi:hypothetical protein
LFGITSTGLPGYYRAIRIFPFFILVKYRNKLILLIAVSTVVRLLTAASVELGNDEVYYWTYAQKLQWNYFDHPPMVAVWIKLFTAALSLEQYELFIRLGSIISCAAATLVLFDTVKKIHSEKAGWYAALLYNASLYAGIIAGLFILPDSPQMLFWCCSLWLLVKISEAPRNTKWWILFGIATGLCIMSKVHGMFLWFGTGIYILAKKREWLRMPQLYLAVLITALIVSPVLLWNIANDFITYRFHSERVAVEEFKVNWTGFATEIFGQLFYNNPFNVIITVAALIATGQRIYSTRAALVIYNFIALPLVCILVAIAFFRNTFPHWSGPAYVTLIPLAAIYIAEKNKKTLLKSALFFIAFILAAGVLLINFFPGTTGKKAIEKLGTGDFTLDMFGWKDAGRSFADIRVREIKAGRMNADAPIVSYKWFPAAHEDYYFCRPSGIEMIGLGNMHDLHHYSWMNKWRMPKQNMQQAWCVIPSNENHDAVEKYGYWYAKIDSLTTIESYRNRKLARLFFVYRLSGWKGFVKQGMPEK